MKNEFIVIEGVDGTGKSTVCQIVADMIEGTTIKTPTLPFIQLRDFYDNSGNPLARFLYYLSTIVIASAEIEKMLEQTPVVCDRYLLSTICYHQAMGIDTSIIDFSKLPILQPDYCLCLTVNEQIRFKRINYRSKIGDTDQHFQLLKIVDRLFTNQIDNVIDTSYLTPQEVALEICRIIQ